MLNYIRNNIFLNQKKELFIYLFCFIVLFCIFININFFNLFDLDFLFYFIYFLFVSFVSVYFSGKKINIRLRYLSLIFILFVPASFYTFYKSFNCDPFFCSTGFMVLSVFFISTFLFSFVFHFLSIYLSKIKTIFILFLNLIVLSVGLFLYLN